MAILVYTYSNNFLVREIPSDSDSFILSGFDGTEKTLMNSTPKLSIDEFGVLLDELADKFMEFAGPDVQPLSDYAVSRESIYEDHL